MSERAMQRYNSILGWLNAFGVPISMEDSALLWEGLQHEMVPISTKTKEGGKEKCLATR